MNYNPSPIVGGLYHGHTLTRTGKNDTLLLHNDVYRWTEKTQDWRYVGKVDDIIRRHQRRRLMWFAAGVAVLIGIAAW